MFLFMGTLWEISPKWGVIYTYLPRTLWVSIRWFWGHVIRWVCLKWGWGTFIMCYDERRTVGGIQNAKYGSFVLQTWSKGRLNPERPEKRKNAIQNHFQPTAGNACYLPSPRTEIQCILYSNEIRGTFIWNPLSALMKGWGMAVAAKSNTRHTPCSAGTAATLPQSADW